MGKEQGDQVPASPPVYVRTVGGVEVERPALTPADEVNLRAQGWVRKTAKRAGSRNGGGGKSAASKSTGDEGGHND